MSNATLVIGSFVDDAQEQASLSGLGTITPISASSAAATMPVTNLTTSIPSIKWRTGSYTAGATVSVSMDIGSINNRAINAFCLYNHNLSPAGQWMLRAYSSQADRDADTDGSGVSYTYSTGWTVTESLPTIGYGTGAYATYGYGGYPLTDWQRYKFITNYTSSTSPTVARWWKLFLKDSGNTSGYLEAGRLLLSKYFEPSVNFEWGYQMGWEDPSKQIRTRGGALRSEFRTPYRKVGVSFSWLNDYDLDFILEIERLIGKRRELLWSAYPNDNSLQGRRNIILGRLSDWSTVAKERQGYKMNFSIEESI